MKGHIEKRGEKYRYKLYLGTNPITGRKKPFNSTSFDTEEEADLEMKLHISKLDYEKKLQRMQALMPGVQGMTPTVPSLTTPGQHNDGGGPASQVERGLR